MTDDRRARLLELIRSDALKLAPAGEMFTLASGRKSNYFVNGKEITLRAEGLHLAASLLLDRLAGSGVEAVGGMSIGADPIIGAMVALSAGTDQPLQGFLVRKGEKDHGLKDRIAGPSLDGVGKVAFVEDTTTTGGSTLEAIAATLAEYPDLQIDRVLSIVDRQEGATDNFWQSGYRFESLFVRDDLGLP